MNVKELIGEATEYDKKESEELAQEYQCICKYGWRHIGFWNI